MAARFQSGQGTGAFHKAATQDQMDALAVDMHRLLPITGRRCPANLQFFNVSNLRYLEEQNAAAAALNHIRKDKYGKFDVDLLAGSTAGEKVANKDSSPLSKEETEKGYRRVNGVPVAHQIILPSMIDHLRTMRQVEPDVRDECVRFACMNCIEAYWPQMSVEFTASDRGCNCYVHDFQGKKGESWLARGFRPGGAADCYPCDESTFGESFRRPVKEEIKRQFGDNGGDKNYTGPGVAKTTKRGNPRTAARQSIAPPKPWSVRWRMEADALRAVQIKSFNKAVQRGLSCPMLTFQEVVQWTPGGTEVCRPILQLAPRSAEDMWYAFQDKWDQQVQEQKIVGNMFVNCRPVLDLFGTNVMVSHCRYLWDTWDIFKDMQKADETQFGDVNTPYPWGQGAPWTGPSWNKGVTDEERAAAHPVNIEARKESINPDKDGTSEIVDHLHNQVSISIFYPPVHPDPDGTNVRTEFAKK